MELYFELAYVPGDEVKTKPFMRLCLALEKRFPNIQEWQQIQDICDIVTENENCFFIFRDTWLKTTVTLRNADSLFRNPLSKDALRERIVRPNGTGVDDHAWTRSFQRISQQLPRRHARTTADGGEPQIAIRRNVLPRQWYWMKLLEFYRRSHLRRGFYTRRILEESLREGKSLQEIRMCNPECELAKSLRPAARRYNKVPAESAAAGVAGLEDIDSTRMIWVKELGIGSEGSVWKVVWDNCTYALKSYKPYYLDRFDIDHKIATMRSVSQHPHIVQAFGYLRSFLEDDDSDPDQTRPNCLLMELLDRDLSRHIYEATRSEAPISRLDKLDVLLQIASAMKRLHENKVVHGDLKPGNILLSDLEVSGHVRHFLAKVADFGSAKIIDPRSDFTPSKGTPTYASPEVLMARDNVLRKLTEDAIHLEFKLDAKAKLVEGIPALNWYVAVKLNFVESGITVQLDVGAKPKKKLDVPAKLDVYSFGVMAYEILTECKAFGGTLMTTEVMYKVATGKTRVIDSKEWKTVNRFGIYNDVVPLVERCLEPDPTKRPTFSKVCAKLRRARLNVQTKERRVSKLKYFMTSVTVILLVLVLTYKFLYFIMQFDSISSNKYLHTPPG